MAKTAEAYAAAEQAAAMAHQPHALVAARRAKAKKSRSRMLSRGHMIDGLRRINRKVHTSKYRDSEPEWWEAGGEDEGEDEPQEAPSNTSFTSRLGVMLRVVLRLVLKLSTEKAQGCTSLKHL